MSRAASKPLPSKKTNRKPGPAGVRRRALRRGDPTASEELHNQADPLDELGDLETEDDEALVAGLEDSSAEELTGDDDQIDDPIRIYLMQMGEIPMLSRARGDDLGPAHPVRPQAAFATTCW